MRADRRREPLADFDQDRAAARDPGADLGVHLLLHAVLERVHLRADVPAIGAEQDGTGRDRQRIRRRRYLSLGLTDGRRACGVVAAGDLVRVLRRALRERDDRGGEGIIHTIIVTGCSTKPLKTASSSAPSAASTVR